MLFPLIVLGIASLIAGAALLPPLARLYRRSPREAVFGGLAALAFGLGAVPIVRIGLFRYMVALDYGWAIRGPAPFDQLGSGPWWLWTLVQGGVAAGVLWGGGFWLLVAAGRDDAGTAHPRPESGAGTRLT